MTVRAKFRCVTKEEQIAYGGGCPRKFTFAPIYQPDVPEDQRFALATPSGQVWLLVDNPAVTFEVGGYYYLDFTPVPAE